MNKPSSQTTAKTKSQADTAPIVAGLDIGTTKVCMVIARSHSDSIEIIGVGQCPSRGLKKGSVINIDITVDAIKRAREEAELMAGIKVEKIWVGVGSQNIRSFNSKGMVAIKNHVVAKDDIKRVLEAARAVALPEDRQIIHLLAQTFAVDSQDGIRDPMGMSGVRLEAGAHLVTGNLMGIQNLERCVQKAGLQVAGLVLEPLAASDAVLSQDEKDLGVALVEMGGGSTDIIIFANGSVVHTAQIPVGGAHLTHDISVGLRTPSVEAEDIKKKYGCAMTSLVEAGETIEVPSVGGRNPRTVARITLAEVIEPRAEEILHLINNEIAKSGYQELIGAGIVLTGGGSLLEGIVELGEFIFEVPVRRGYAMHTTGLKEVVQSPVYATAVGLVRYGAIQGKDSATRGSSIFEKIRTSFGQLLDGAF
ncbi:MAG: cell division protein FtsA [Oligoflexia bacterium]|nr:cell division protein FtsA [Oligoflexia bacterium]